MSRLVRPLITGLCVTAVAGWLVAQAPPQDPAAALRHIQDTLKSLQAEVKKLQDAINRQGKEAKKGSSAPAPVPPAAQPSANPVVPVKSEVQKSAEAVRRGMELEAQSLCRAAIEAYNDAVLADPRNDAALYRRAECYLQLGEVSNAEASYTQSLQVQPNNSRAYAGRAAAYTRQGKTAEALADVNEAILRDDRNAESFILRARLNEVNNDSQRAVADYTQALSLKPNSEIALLGRAASLLSAGQTNSALADCDSAARVNPNSSSAALCRAEVFLLMKSPERAIEAVSQALLAAQITNQPVPLLDYLGPSLQSSIARTAALAGVAKMPPVMQPSPAVSEVVSAPSVQAVLGPTLQAFSAASTISKPPASGKPSVPEALKPSPSRAGYPNSALAAAVAPGEAKRGASYYESLSREQAGKQNFEEALRLIDRALQMNPRSAKAFNARGYIHLRMRNYPQAVDDFSQALNLDPSYSNAYHNRAVVRRLVGQIVEADADERNARKYASPVMLPSARPDQSARLLLAPR